ncbi:hypothetical protein A176_002992 [Myxococcus hansupus]|uniref:Uncharacterized protein n=1 Tax=Pseudomyxococcus hansupus TaxID=1297742 RepID=A0A0H4WXL6_9BACT|nr:hypothetical protein A176_002992 [Myxococcus hansupus]
MLGVRLIQAVPAGAECRLRHQGSPYPTTRVVINAVSQHANALRWLA